MEGWQGSGQHPLMLKWSRGRGLLAGAVPLEGEDVSGQQVEAPDK